MSHLVSDIRRALEPIEAALEGGTPAAELLLDLTRALARAQGFRLVPLETRGEREVMSAEARELADTLAAAARERPRLRLVVLEVDEPDHAITEDAATGGVFVLRNPRDPGAA